MSIGQRIVQTAHVAAEFQMNYPKPYNDWLRTNRSIITFSVSNGIELLDFEKFLNEKGVETFRFFEPDYNQVTGIGIVPSELARKLTSSLKLARESDNTTFIDRVTYDMMNTEQMENLTVLEHGIMVNKMYNKIMDNIDSLTFKFEKVPKWLQDYGWYFNEELKKVNENIIREYQIYHDCGKPYTITIDENGRKHFPNHAQKSYETWLSMGGNSRVSNLMLHDMDMHTMKAKDIENFMKHDDFLVLMITSVAELYANSEMFGGMDSTSFKIKFKQIEKRGNAIMKILAPK